MVAKKVALKAVKVVAKKELRMGMTKAVLMEQLLVPL